MYVIVADVVFRPFSVDLNKFEINLEKRQKLDLDRIWDDVAFLQSSGIPSSSLPAFVASNMKLSIFTALLFTPSVVSFTM